MGFGQLREERADGGGGGRGSYVKELKWGDGDVVRLYFPDPTNPHVFRSHRCVDLGGRKYQQMTCLGKDCPFCSASIEGDARINKSSVRTGFSVYPTTKFHLVPAKDNRGNLKKTKKGEQIFDEIPCKGKVCKVCKTDPNPPILLGLRRAEFAGMYAEALAGVLDEVAQFAIEGWTQDEESRVVIERVGWECPLCEAKIKEHSYTWEQFQQQKPSTCPKCKSDVVFRERIKDGLTRVNLASGEWRIKRTGKDTGTSFTFEFLGVSEAPEEAFASSLDLEQFYAPLSPRKAAETIGGSTARPLSRPGAMRGRSESYEEDGGEDEDPEEAAPPSSSSKGAVKRPIFGVKR